MKRLSLPLLTISALGLAACQDAVAPTASDDALTPQLAVRQEVERVVPGRVLVRLAGGADATEVAQAHGAVYERTLANGRVAVVRGAAGNERALAARMSEDIRVVYAEPDYLRQPIEVHPNIWSFSNPGELTVDYTRGRRSGSPVTNYESVAGADIAAVLSGSPTGGEVSIASIDTGVETGHPEFADVLFGGGWDHYSNDDDPSDTNDHGTHTTGTMAGRTVGVWGAALPGAKVTVHVYRVCGGNGCPTSAIVDAINDATAAGVVAMNLSLGGGSLSQSEADAIQAATEAGSLVIAAAGNDGTGTVSCPACDPNAISVAATNWQDELSYYSNWGPGLDISAPGGELYSNTTDESGIWSAVRGGGYAYFQGTSMATPHVTGAAAVVSSVTGATGETLRARLLCKADDLGDGGYDESFGHGRLNLGAAVAGSNDTSCLGSGSGGGDNGGGDTGGGTGEFGVDLTAGKLKGVNAIRINDWTGYTGSTVDMTVLEVGRTDEDVARMYIYSTGQKGGATYTVEVCTNEPTPRCVQESVVF